jgi:hypothetical protein
MKAGLASQSVAMKEYVVIVTERRPARTCILHEQCALVVCRSVARSLECAGAAVSKASVEP